MNICDEQDNIKTPLHYASLACDVACVRMLLEQGASVCARDYWGRTPLLCAPVMLLNTKEGHELRKVITVDDKSVNACLSLLLEYGSDVNAQDEASATALHALAKTKGSLRHINLFLQHGANETIRDQDANTLLKLACSKIRRDPLDILDTTTINQDRNPGRRSREQRVGQR